MSRLPFRYRLLNWLIKWSGRQFAEDHFGYWRPKHGGGIECQRIPLGTYSLRTRSEAGLRQDATNIERVAAKNSKDAGHG